MKGEKQPSFYKCTQKSIISIPPRDTKPEFRGHGKVVFHVALEFSDCDEPFVRKSSESGQIGRAVDSRRWLGMATRSTFRALPWGEGSVLPRVNSVLSALGLNASSSTNRVMHYFVIKLAFCVTEQDVRKRLMCHLSVFLP